MQVTLHEPGQYSLQAVGMHCDVRRTSQAVWLPPVLMPPATAAAVRAVQLAEAAAAPLLPASSSGTATGQAGLTHGQAAGSSSSGGVAAGPAPQHVEQQQQQQSGAGRGRAVDAAAAASGDAGAACKQVQQLLEAGMRGVGLDDGGAVVEFGWARQRTAPARWLQTAACVQLGGSAAAGSLQVLAGGAEQRPVGSGSCGQAAAVGVGLQGLQSAGAAAGLQSDLGGRFQGLLPRAAPEEDGVPQHWAAAGQLGLARGPAILAASHSGRVLQLQRLPPGEGQLLLRLQDVLLRHPLTSSMVLGRQQGDSRKAATSSSSLQPQQERSEGFAAASSVLASDMQGAGAAAANGRVEVVGLPPRKLGVIDGELLSTFLALPYQMQLLLLDSALPPAGGGGGDMLLVMLLQEGLRCRLQQLAVQGRLL